MRRSCTANGWHAGRCSAGEGSGKAIAASGNVDDISDALGAIAQGLAQSRDVEAEAALIDIDVSPTRLTNSRLSTTSPACSASTMRMSSARPPMGSGVRCFSNNLELGTSRNGRKEMAESLLFCLARAVAPQKGVQRSPYWSIRTKPRVNRSRIANSFDAPSCRRPELYLKMNVLGGFEPCRKAVRNSGGDRSA